MIILWGYLKEKSNFQFFLTTKREKIRTELVDYASDILKLKNDEA